MKTDLDLFREYCKQRKTMGSPLLESREYSVAENAIIREVNDTLPAETALKYRGLIED